MRFLDILLNNYLFAKYLNIMKPKKRITMNDYVKANRTASRNAEIDDHGHPVCHKKIHKSKKVYDRKKIQGR